MLWWRVLVALIGALLRRPGQNLGCKGICDRGGGHACERCRRIWTCLRD